MRQIILRFGVVAAVLAMCGQSVFAMANIKVKEKTIAAANEFAIEVLQQLSKSSPGENIAVSAMSIRSAMSLAWAGASGETATQLQHALRIEKPSDFAETYGLYLRASELSGDCTLDIANSAWTQYSLLGDYAKICKQDFLAGVFSADFMGNCEAQRKRINEWISGRTQKMIPELLKQGDVDRDTLLVLANAIYLRGFWATQFKPTRTSKRPFRISDDKIVQADMMYGKVDVTSFQDNELIAVRLGYKGGDASMIAIMPKNSTAEKLDKFIADMTPKKLRTLFNQLDGQADEKLVFFPKFKLDCRYELKQLFEKLGVMIAFTPQADFSKMTREKMFISKIIHQAVIDVDEQGTKAAAATAVTMKRTCAIIRPLKFDRPFVFFIRNDRTFGIVFAGKVVDPTK